MTTSNAFASDAPPAYIPVPLGLLPDMISHLTELMAEGSKIENPLIVSPVTPTAKDTPAWSEDELSRLLPLLHPQNEVALAVLDMTAAKPGQLVSFPDACLNTVNKKNPLQGRAGIAALTKNCHKIGKADWPVTWHWAEGGQSVAYYKMSPEIARLWLKVRSAAP